jgi:murein DD-endopeptidase MepM/ murein hydrolase activator NlpD
MSKFARGMKKNKRVNQGQTIGYVGSTGMAKGPHLHYEVRKKGKSINPAKFKGTANITLKGESLKSYKKARDNIKDLLKNTLAN